MIKRLFTALSFGLALAISATAEEPYEPRPLEELLIAGVTYDADIPTPADITGYEVGEIIWPHELVIQYVRTVDAVSDRIMVEQVAESHLGRPILAVYVSSPENLARLDEIKAGRAAVLNGDAPGVDIGVHQINYGVHGSEPSSYDSAPLMVYHLAAAQDAATEALLNDNVVILMTTLNPDGASRMANWVNSHRAAVPVAYPAHREHTGFFAGGRTNHYFFDLNRQWLPVAQPEHRGLVPHIQEWLPLLVVDKHEMGSNSTFFFSPAAEDQINQLFDEEVYQITAELSESLYEVFDGLGQLSVSQEFFPNYYLGYGSSYPTLLGAVPFLFEQGSARGMVQDTDNGLKRYDQTILEQFQAAVALLGEAAQQRQRLQSFQRRWFADSSEKARANPTKAYLFTSNDQGRFAHFLDLLNAHSIDVRFLDSDQTIDGYTYPANRSAFVELDQPRYALIEGIFADQNPPEDQVVFYDISGWTLPHAFGLKHTALSSRQASRIGIGASASRAGLAAPILPPAPGDEVLAYVIDWSHFNAPRAVNRILRHELRAKVIPDPVRLETPNGFVDVPRGAVIVPTRRQDMSPENIYALIVRAVEEDGVTVHASLTSRTPSGSDLGGFSVDALEAPKVLLLTGRAGASGVSDNDAGEVWHYLDQMLHIPVTMIDVTNVNSRHLSDHTHIIAVGGAYGALSDSFVDTLKSWIRDGGVFIGTQSGAEWAVAQGLADIDMLGVDRVDDETEAKKDEDEKEPPVPVSYEDKLDYDRQERITGAVFAGVIDPTHPLGFGYDGNEIFVHKEGEKGFEPGDNPFGLVVRYAEAPLASGYASVTNLERLSGKGMLAAERVGAGSVILFADNPNFRAYWLGTKRLFSNSLFFAKTFTNPAARPE
ncbi:MAG: carboxypeptidase [Henriciella sp.]|nr:carboxypeptidase [Henriciella sp.]